MQLNYNVDSNLNSSNYMKIQVELPINRARINRARPVFVYHLRNVNFLWSFWRRSFCKATSPDKLNNKTKKINYKI